MIYTAFNDTELSMQSMETPAPQFPEITEWEKAQGLDKDMLLNRKEAARYINFTPGTLAVWDCTKRYDLKPIKIGRSVRYRKSDLDAFLDQWIKP